MSRPPSSNWLALKKTLDTDSSRKRPKKSKKRALSISPTEIDTEIDTELDGSALCRMVRGQVHYTLSQQLPGKHIALDCEMVGVGTDGSESSLARVSVVNLYGAVLLDEFVRQRERVVDYRTQYSGVRPRDMVHAKPFADVQNRVAELLQDRILVGHALSNDLTALLLSHPRSQTRDTQYYAWKHKLVKTGRVALRNLVQQELRVAIQGGEHSSVTDARAAMAVYRLHRKEWEGKTRSMHVPKAGSKKRKNDEGEARSKKRKHDVRETETEMSTMTKKKKGGEQRNDWWSVLDSAGPSGWGEDNAGPSEWGVDSAGPSESFLVSGWG